MRFKPVAYLRIKKKQAESGSIIKPVALAVCIIILLFSLSACLNPTGIDNCGYVVTIGVDSGEKKEYEILLELQRESSGEGQQTDGGAIIISVEADNLFEAINEASHGVAYTLNFSRTHVFIFSEELARQGRIEDFLNISFDMLRIRQSALMLITHCKVRDYVGGIAANGDANIAKTQDYLISDVQQTGIIAAINVSRFNEACDGGRFDPVIPMGYYDEKIITDKMQSSSESKGENPIKDAEDGKRIGGMQGLTIGAALFNAGTMTGVLNGADTQLMNIVKGDFCQGTIAFPVSESESAALFVTLKKRRIRVEIGENDTLAKAALTLNITVEHDPSKSIGEEWKDGERDRIKAYLESELQRVFNECRSSDCDAMGFGRYASMNFYSTADWEAFNWKSVYKTMRVQFDVELNLDDEYIAKLRQ